MFTDNEIQGAGERTLLNDVQFRPFVQSLNS